MCFDKPFDLWHSVLSRSCWFEIRIEVTTMYDAFYDENVSLQSELRLVERNRGRIWPIAIRLDGVEMERKTDYLMS